MDPKRTEKTVSKFREDISAENSKIVCPSNQQLHGHAKCALAKGGFHIFLIIAVWCVNTPKYLSCLQSFPKVSA